MTELQIGTGLMDVKVETNYTPAAVEQKSPEPITSTEPSSVTAPELTSSESVIDFGDDDSTPLESVQAAPKLAKSAGDDDANAAARRAIEDRLRAENAERRLRELQPKIEVPEKAPDINDKATWGKKYQDAPNDHETFLKARDEWAREEGRKAERSAYAQAEQQRQAMAVHTEVERKQQESRAKHSDYDSVINPIVPVIANIPLLKDFIAKDPMGTEVAYELGRNPVILQKLLQSMQIDVWQAGGQLLSMAARLKKSAATQITNAPEPIKPVGSRETIKPNLSQLSDGDYIKMRNKQELAKKRG